MDAISIRQARQSANIVRRSLIIDGAVVEICAYPEVREETVQMVEPQSVLMLGLSRLLTGSEGRKAGDPRRPFARMGGAGAASGWRAHGVSCGARRVRYHPHPL